MNSQVAAGTAHNGTEYVKFLILALLWMILKLARVAQAMHEELASWNIRACLVVAGYLHTEMWSDTNLKKGHWRNQLLDTKILTRLSLI